MSAQGAVHRASWRFLEAATLTELGCAVSWRALFGYFCGALTVFYNLAVDFNKPFDGVFTLESGTLTATLRQMRDRVGVYIDV